MAQSPNTNIENNFVEGLKTEFTGLNFPENACTSASNCVFTLIGDVFRRQGIDFELNFTGAININRTGQAMSSYVWTNVGGDGQTKVYVLQIGQFIYFFQFTNSTIASPMSTTKLSSVVNMSSFQVLGSILNSVECQFSDGNGFLFIFHPGCDPVYCTFTAGVITANVISIQIRDFLGIPENISDDTRPSTLSNEHKYNLINQGWTVGAWSAVGGGFYINTGPVTFTVASGLTITNGDSVQIGSNIVQFVPGGGVVYSGPPTTIASGSVTSYSGTSLTINITSINNSFSTYWSNISFISQINVGFITTWFSAIGNYPSNADVWWSFKDSTGVFPSGASLVTRVNNVTLSSGPAPKGSEIMSAFNQTRSAATGIMNLTDIKTNVRPRTGTWFQGRVFYAGVDAAQAAIGDAPFYTWTENIYFSQIIQNNNVIQFSKCYQLNDPTSETLFDLLPTDGGVITIQGSGAIYKLFPVTNGLLVFAANGVWFITGSQGIGFSATDYTVTKISGVQSISSTSYVNVLGYPIFWNEEGIYGVAPAQTGALQVNNLCLGTILTYYNNIPMQSKKFVRGDYDPISFIVKWIYRSTNESSVTDRYQFDTVLNFNVIHKSFYPYTLPNGSSPNIHDVKFIQTPGGAGNPLSVMKYVCSYPDGSGLGTVNYTFAEENNFNYRDWQAFDGVGVNFISTFTTGYKLHGQALRKFQPMYVYVYSRNDVPTAYTINAVWDFATSPLSNRFSVRQQTQNYLKKYQGMLYRRHRLRGRGMSLQLQFTSFDGQPFELMGWAIYEHIEMSP